MERLPWPTKPLVHKESIMPLISLDSYGEAVEWALKHLQESLEKLASAGPSQPTFDQIADVLQQ
ncbi:uncharacterized protein PV07_08772 [Cladophialophora immunda]|uniref:Uncharacterized protein n=1 Tax=Cladophialophora immunda TaxID=569365 RepID=A0A0D1ZCY1_9EURO|nr:uncharacterized protein PV07_08772 [Cladophialophora immunda]KIW25606.1 hypothetical protein PV07_08772 [Cladophialophora immunda]